MSSKQPTSQAKAQQIKLLGFFVLSLCFSALANGQAPGEVFLVNDSTVGMKYSSGLPVLAKRYVVNGKLFKWHWDGYSNNLLLELKESDHKKGSFTNRGTLNMVDMDTKNIKWSRPANYNSSDVKLMGEYCFHSERKRNHRLNPETGEVMWMNKNEFYFIDPVLNIGVGYPLQSLSNKLTAVDLSNGKELWNKRVNRAYGWDDAYMFDDSTLLISVEGIKTINLTNGKGWSYNASTSHKEIGKMIGFNALNIILGLIFDVYAWQNEPNIYSDLVSNMLIDPHGNIVLASKNRITKVNSSGSIQWSSPLPKKKTSKSTLFLIGSRIFMINRGHALYNRGFSTVGIPYLASFDLQSGKQLFLVPIAQKEEFVRNFQVVNNRLFVAFEDRIAAYSLNDGSVINEKTLELDKGEFLDLFVDSGIYRKVTWGEEWNEKEIGNGEEDESRIVSSKWNWNRNGKKNEPLFKELMSDFSNHNFMMTSEGRVFILKDNLETVWVYDKEDLYHVVLNNDRYTLVSNNNTDFILLDSSSVAIAIIKASAELFINENALYFFDKDSFWEIDLNQFNRPSNIWHSIFNNIFPHIVATGS